MLQGSCLFGVLIGVKSDYIFAKGTGLLLRSLSALIANRSMKWFLATSCIWSNGKTGGYSYIRHLRICYEQGFSTQRQKIEILFLSLAET